MWCCSLLLKKINEVGMGRNRDGELSFLEIKEKSKKEERAGGWWRRSRLEMCYSVWYKYFLCWCSIRV